MRAQIHIGCTYTSSSSRIPKSGSEEPARRRTLGSANTIVRFAGRANGGQVHEASERDSIQEAECYIDSMIW